ncbi:ribonuclease E activity regulator RraA [Methylomonas paludis]|uniref:4-hydroxy-4-methyl-2-oxoglutarate aldolase n=1 Tax=Methylomonas paludis TaxID=1173101 RepID=A0A975R9R3_9GAMM|nr:ribonuclease E activity regulator RraA [Methylomonas paludis]QWF70461.1 ribonuclease E activity regulator RraA [Methylomonas paludis]
MTFQTAELCDQFSDRENFQIAEPIFKQYGQKRHFSGLISTLKVFEDYALIQSTLEQKVNDRVLVIDGGGSRRCALFGATLAELAVANGWQGVLIYGCIRGAEQIDQLPIGVIALNTHPLRSHKHAPGETDILITFAGVNFKKNHYLYADCDGIIVAETKLD